MLTLMEIIYTYIHWDQKMSTMKEIKEMLYAINRCLANTYNTHFPTNFTKFRPFLPSQVNVLQAQIHRNAYLIYHVNHKIDVFKICAHKYIDASMNLLVMLEHVQRFIAVHLSQAKAK